MTPTPRPPSKIVGLPRSRVRLLPSGQALVVLEDGPPRLFEKDGSLSPIQLVYSAPPDDAS